MLKILKKWLPDSNERRIRKYFKIVDKIEALEEEISTLSDEELGPRRINLRSIEEGIELDDLLPEAYAVVREAGKRTIGMRHFRVQLLGGIVLHHGDIAEMKTGGRENTCLNITCLFKRVKAKRCHYCYGKRLSCKAGS